MMRTLQIGRVPVLSVILLLGLISFWSAPAQGQTEKSILTYSFSSIPDATGTIDQVNYNISVTVPNSQNVTALVATFTLSPGATAYVNGVQQVSGVTPNNFTGQVIYTVIAANLSTRNYYVNVTKAAARTDKSITDFRFAGLSPVVEGTINESARTIALTVPFATSVTSLAATFTNSYLSTVLVGSQVQTSGVTTNNFTNPVSYTVLAEDGSSQTYTVTVTKSPASALCAITDFKFTNLTPNVNGSIIEGAAGANGVITLTIPYTGASKTSLVATFVHSEFSVVSVNNVTQTNGVTVNNFTSDLTYKVTAQNGTIKNYIVHVEQAAPSRENQILTYKFEASRNPALVSDVTGVVNQTTKTIALTVPFGTSLSGLIATFTNSQFATVRVGSSVQVSGTTANTFSSPVVYSCTAEDGSSELYTVTVNQTASSNKALTSFGFNGFSPVVNGTINEGAKTVSVTVPFGTDRSSLVATFTSSANSIVKVGPVTQTSGVTPNDFTIPRTYTVVAEDLTTQDYVVTVTVGAQSNQCAITAFSFQGFSPAAVGVIDQTAGTIHVTIPQTNGVLGNLVATFTNSSYSTVRVMGVPQISGTTPNQFYTAQTYQVTAQDGVTTKDYVVSVSFWTCNPADFGYDFEINTVVEINGVPQGAGPGAASRLAAFVGDQCRGTVTGGQVQGLNYVFTLRVYSNVASGETVSFKFYDPGLDRILDVTQTHPFVQNVDIGTLLAPTTLDCLTYSTYSRSLAIGWSWFSVNIEHANMSLAARMASVAPVSGDYIKNQTQSAIYNGLAWVGSLTTLDPRTMYKAKLGNGGVLSYDGDPYDPAANPITINTGWNWIGFIPEETQDVTTALTTLVPMEEDCLKGHIATTTWYTSTGWFGVLNTMQPTQGYMLRSGKPATITYVSGLPMKGEIIDPAREIPGQRIPDATQYEYSGQVIATVQLDGMPAERGNLYTLINGEVRGISAPSSAGQDQDVLYLPLVFSNVAEGEIIRFRFHDADSDEWYEFEETLTFRADMIEPGIQEPLRLQKAKKLAGVDDMTAEPGIRIYPNPINGSGIIEMEPGSETWTLRLYDSFGRLIREWNPGVNHNARVQLNLDANGLADGIYYVRLITPARQVTRSVIIAE